MRKSIIIITHKLNETLAIADSISVLRDGVMVETGISVKNTNATELARLMVGRNVELGVIRRSKNIADKSFEIKNLNLTTGGHSILSDINMKVHKGEILGIAGIEGNGQTELIEVLTGLRKPDTGTLLKDGRKINGEAADFIRNKIGHIPEDRMTRGLVADMTIADNLILGYHKTIQFASKGIFKSNDVIEYAKQKSKEYKIKAQSVHQKCSTLSGGNQQ